MQDKVVENRDSLISRASSAANQIIEKASQSDDALTWMRRVGTRLQLLQKNELQRLVNALEEFAQDQTPETRENLRKQIR